MPTWRIWESYQTFMSRRYCARRLLVFIVFNNGTSLLDSPARSYGILQICRTETTNWFWLCGHKKGIHIAVFYFIMCDLCTHVQVICLKQYVQNIDLWMIVLYLVTRFIHCTYWLLATNLFSKFQCYIIIKNRNL